MSDTLRAVALLLSLALWSPVAGQLLRGEASVERAGVLYAAALLLALVGCSALAQVIAAYTPKDAPVEEPAEAAAPPGGGTAPADAAERARRQQDAAA